MADGDIEPGVYVQEVGRPLHLKEGHLLADLPKFAEKYGVDLVIHSVGEGRVTAQIEALVVVTQTNKDKN